jgi:hypothetical protein
MMTAMLALMPDEDVVERKSILAALNNNPNIENYIYENLENELEQFFVVEQKFWDSWCVSISFFQEQ